MDLAKGIYEERLKDGELLLFSRNRTFYARVYKGEGTRSYLYRSLKTKDLSHAREKADEFFHEIRIKKRDNLPLDNKRFKDVIAEYLKLRKSQFDRGTYKHANKVNQQQTSEQVAADVAHKTGQATLAQAKAQQIGVETEKSALDALMPNHLEQEDTD